MKRPGLVAAGASCAFASACGSPNTAPQHTFETHPLVTAEPTGLSQETVSPPRPSPAPATLALSRTMVAQLFEQQLVAAQQIEPGVTAKLRYLRDNESFHCGFDGKIVDISADLNNANLFCSDQDTIVIDHNFINALGGTAYPAHTTSIFFAHEIGHAIQKSAGLYDSGRVDSGLKLLGEKQADCYSAQIVRLAPDFNATIALKAAMSLYEIGEDAQDTGQSSADDRLHIFQAGLAANADCTALDAP